MAFSLSRNERVFLQQQTALLTIPNTAGTATVGNSNASRHVRVGLNNNVALLVRPDKTGTRTQTAGTAGRKFAQWSLEQGLAANGTAGVKPDTDPVLKALMGQDGTTQAGSAAITGATNATPIVITATAHGYANGDAVFISGVLGNTAANGAWIIAAVTTNTFELIGSAGNGAYTSGGTASRVNVKYLLSDSIPFFTMYAFRTPAAIEQRCIFGSVVSEAVFNLGQDVATWSANGEGIWVLDSKYFANADATQKGGLTSFPAEPGAPVTNGGLITGFTGRFVVDGKNIANIQSATLRIATGNQIVKDTFGQSYGDAVEGDERQVTLDFSVYDDDATASDNLKKVSYDKTSVEAVLQVGNVVGNIWIWYMKGFQLAAPTYDDGQRRFKVNFNGSRGFGTSITALNEIALHIV